MTNKRKLEKDEGKSNNSFLDNTDIFPLSVILDLFKLCFVTNSSI